MAETPEELSKKALEILASGVKDREKLNEAVEFMANALKLQFGLALYSFFFSFIIEQKNEKSR